MHQAVGSTNLQSLISSPLQAWASQRVYVLRSGYEIETLPYPPCRQASAEWFLRVDGGLYFVSGSEYSLQGTKKYKRVIRDEHSEIYYAVDNKNRVYMFSFNSLESTFCGRTYSTHELHDTGIEMDLIQAAHVSDDNGWSCVLLDSDSKAYGMMDWTDLHYPYSSDTPVMLDTGVSCVGLSYSVDHTINSNGGPYVGRIVDGVLEEITDDVSQYDLDDLIHGWDRIVFPAWRTDGTVYISGDLDGGNESAVANYIMSALGPRGHGIWEAPEGSPYGGFTAGGTSTVPYYDDMRIICTPYGVMALGTHGLQPTSIVSPGLIIGETFVLEHPESSTRVSDVADGPEGNEEEEYVDYEHYSLSSGQRAVLTEEEVQNAPSINTLFGQRWIATTLVSAIGKSKSIDATVSFGHEAYSPSSSTYLSSLGVRDVAASAGIGSRRMFVRTSSGVYDLSPSNRGPVANVSQAVYITELVIMTASGVYSTDGVEYTYDGSPFRRKIIAADGNVFVA